MTASLKQTDINALASQVERLSGSINTLSEAIFSQEAALDSIGSTLHDRLTPFVDKLNGVFAGIEADKDSLAETLSTVDSNIGDKSTEVDILLTEVLEMPPVAETLEQFDQAINTAENVNKALVDELAALEALVENAEEGVLNVVDALKEQSTELADELLETLSSNASGLSDTLAERVFAPVRDVMDSFSEQLTESITEQVEVVLDRHIEQIAGDVADALDAVLEQLRRSIDELMDEIAEQLELDTETERTERQALEVALAPLEAAFDILRAAYEVFQDIAGTVGISIPDLD